MISETFKSLLLKQKVNSGKIKLTNEEQAMFRIIIDKSQVELPPSKQKLLDADLYAFKKSASCAAASALRATPPTAASPHPSATMPHP